MSRLKLFWPEDVSEAADEPAVLSFLDYYSPQTLRLDPAIGDGGDSCSQRDVVTRTRAIHDNQCCPVCDRAAVEPLVAKDAWIGRNHRLIPGTATLIGFHCCHCEHRWSA